MRAWEPQEGESPRAFSAFKIYRDLGPERTQRAVADQLYGERGAPRWNHGLRQIETWSSRFGWVDRCRGFDDWLTMRDQTTIEEFRNTRAAEFFERQMELREKLLTNAEKAVDQAAKMLDWPLTEQRVLGHDGEGNEVTYVFVPANWSKATAATFQNMAAGAVTGAWATAKPAGGEDDEDAYDLSDLSDAELEEYLRLAGKVKVKRKWPRN